MVLCRNGYQILYAACFAARVFLLEREKQLWNGPRRVSRVGDLKDAN